MIISLNVKLVDGIYHEDDWKCEIELDEAEAFLEDLHLAIQDAVGFGNDHPYVFFVARGSRSSRRESFPCDNSGHIETKLKELYPLENSNRLFYRFDFGDEWIFQIGRSRKKPKEPEPGTKYPRVVSEEGVKPTQYPSAEY
ncbi:IS1096 element passenger TnpR family protein [Endozoicomonas sp.]|uniref:IS1096 element passenger TnpR family protein n=1 Tax=Endozoicomonas sp. TaxID=1892382 RepID=UPI00383ADCF4